jgi:flavin reductase (DIM6/NTAB) family NADH-FMN oxidoreductase RutF
MISFVPDEMERRDAYRLMTSVIVPRPIAWVSTISVNGIPNLAPYSFFNGVGGQPPTVMFSVSQRRGGGKSKVKDTLRNAQETGEFVVNLVDEALAEAMNLTAGEYSYEVDEFEIANLETVASIDVKPPRVNGTPIAMEAKVTQIVPVEGTTNTMVLGRVVRYHIREGLVRPNGTVDPVAFGPVGRLGSDEYASLGKVFSMIRPIIEESPKGS